MVKKLKEKKISEEIIEKVLNVIDKDLYLSNFDKVVDKYLKMYERKSFKIKENLVKNKLEEYGYENDLISTIDISNDSENELSLAKTALLKLLKTKSYYLNNYENVNKIKAKLVMKGFSYDIINLALEEVKKDETH